MSDSLATQRVRSLRRLQTLISHAEWAAVTERHALAAGDDPTAAVHHARQGLKLVEVIEILDGPEFDSLLRRVP